MVTILKDCFKARRANQGKKNLESSIEYQQTIHSSENEMQKVFKLVNNKKNQVENLTQQQVDMRANEAIERFRRENPKIDPTKKIFAVLGQY